MTGLTGARVIVVDDQESEALPILKAFAKEGVPVAFFDSEIESLPQECLTGVRLAILDMDLVGGTDQKSKISTLVNYLKRILRPDNGPYSVIAWTNRPELLNSFEKAVFSEKDMPKPILSLMITKAECKDLNGAFDLSIISQKLRGALSEFSPLLFLQRWEGKCFQAATEVTNGLSALVAPQTKRRIRFRENWRGQFLQLLHAMAKAQADQHLNRSTCLSAVYGSFGPLYADRMESHAADLSDEFAQNSEEILNTSPECGIDRKAKINTTLHLAFEGLERFTGGNLYTFLKKKKPSWLPDGHAFIEDFVQGEKGKPGTITKIDYLEGIYIPVLLEISANCDHAQKNIRLARFIFGLALPANERGKIKRNAGFIWEFGPLSLKGRRGRAGEYNIYFSARHVVSLELGKAERMNPHARLRGQALVDLQAWLARHAARPGMVLLQQ